MLCKQSTLHSSSLIINRRSLLSLLLYLIVILLPVSSSTEWPCALYEFLKHALIVNIETSKCFCLYILNWLNSPWSNASSWTWEFFLQTSKRLYIALICIRFVWSSNLHHLVYKHLRNGGGWLEFNFCRFLIMISLISWPEHMYRTKLFI